MGKRFLAKVFRAVPVTPRNLSNSGGGEKISHCRNHFFVLGGSNEWVFPRASKEEIHLTGQRNFLPKIKVH
jgi:hypothetical protein